MSAPLAVPQGPSFALALPPGWEQVELDASGTSSTPDLDFAALRLDGLGSTVRPSIAVNLLVDQAGATPDQLLKRAEQELTRRVQSLRVLDRRAVAAADAAPSATQVLQVTLGGRDGHPGTELVQIITFLIVALRAEPGSRERLATVVELTATCAPDQLPVVAPEFERFVASLRLSDAADAADAADAKDR